MGKTWYLCDGEVEKCRKTSCYKNGGDCVHTSDANHARNFSKGPCESFWENVTAPEDQTQNTLEEI